MTNALRWTRLEFASVLSYCEISPTSPSPLLLAEQFGAGNDWRCTQSGVVSTIRAPSTVNNGCLSYTLPTMFHVSFNTPAHQIPSMGWSYIPERCLQGAMPQGVQNDMSCSSSQEKKTEDFLGGWTHDVAICKYQGRKKKKKGREKEKRGNSLREIQTKESWDTAPLPRSVSARFGEEARLTGVYRRGPPHA